MEYVFGTKGDTEVLKTKGREHSSLEGFCEVERTYPDQVITDRFRVVEKTGSSEDAEGFCYDWYQIDRHYRERDRYTPQIARTEQEVTELEITAMELGQLMTELEITLMEREG